MASLKVPELKVTEKVSDLGGYLKEQRESARLSLRQLASAAGVSNPYLSQIERGLRKPSAEVLQGIAKGLQISAEALFQRAGLLENSGGAEVEAAIGSDARLTSRQKRVLLDIYATFRAENARSEVADVAAQIDTADPAGTAVEEGQAAPVMTLVTSTPATTPATRRRRKKSASGS
jgi:transcriptional regulator with XRE-family HTH domain